MPGLMVFRNRSERRTRRLTRKNTKPRDRKRLEAVSSGNQTALSSLQIGAANDSMLSEISARIDQRLLELGMSATQASEQAGLHRDAIRNIRRNAEKKRSDGRLGVEPRTIAALAKVLQTSPGWLLTGGAQDERAADASPPTAAALAAAQTAGDESGGTANGGATGAGFIPFVEWDDAAEYTAPDKPIKSDTTLGEHAWPRGTFVTRVRDDALNRIAPAGSYIVVDRTERMVSSGLIYLGVLDGQVILRRWFPNPERAEPFSLDPSFQIEYLKPGRRWEIIGRVRRIFLDV